MTPKPASVNVEASQRDVSEQPAADSDSDAVDGLETSKPLAESYDDSLEAILLQAGARPPEAPASKFLGSKTLMGLGIEGLNLAGLRAGAPTKVESTPGSEAPAPDADAAAIQVDDLIETNGSKPPGEGLVTKPAAALTSDDTPQVTSLLDDVAQALNVQANEYRDRARGRLPGMPSPSTASGAPGMAAGQAKAEPGHMEAEFEDPDDVPNALTPGTISVIDEDDAGGPDLVGAEDASAAAMTGGDETGAAPFDGGGASKSKEKDAKPGSRPLLVPPVPGLSLAPPPTAPVGPPPGLAPRAPTPPSGLAPPPSGRVRLPTPLPGLPVPALPAPAVGRVTLPPGLVSAAALSAPDLAPAARSTPITLEAAGPSSGGIAALPGSGRVSARRSARVTEQVVPISSPLPAILTAHVKLATVSLAGLIAVTFAGGLFVGMLVWKGQARTEPAPSARIAANAAPSATAPGAAGVGVAPGAGAMAPAAAPGTASAIIAPPNAAPGASQAEPVVAPLPVVDSAPPEPPARPVRRLAAAPRPKRPVVTPTVADTAALFPKSAAAAKPAVTRPAASGGAAESKPMANNAAAKPAAKSKVKTTWHDPFAD